MEFEQIKRLFLNNQLQPLSDEWLEGCIQWCKENLPPNHSMNDLYEMVLEQWLVLDFRDIEIPSLPPQLAQKTKFTLTGVFCVQLMQIIDISKPKLWQLQRIRNKVAKNTEPESDFGKRVLQMTLTDGVQVVEAFEFKPILPLSINMTPGAKLKLMGPIMVRKGRIMLEEQNIKYLGGSVDDLVIKNAAENVLARALGLEENPTPFKINEVALEVQTQNNQTQINQSNTFPLNPNVPPPGPNPPPPPQTLPSDFLVDDDLLRELETNFEEEEDEAQRCLSPDIFNEEEEELSRPNEVIMLDDTFDNIDIDRHLDNIDEELAMMPCSTQRLESFKQNIPSPNLVTSGAPKPKIFTIEKLQSLIPNVTKGKFKLKARFISCAERLKLTADGFYLIIKIEDSTGVLAVELDPSLAEVLAGMRIERLKELRMVAYHNQDTAARNEIRQALSNIMDKIKNLDNVVEVQVMKGEKYPLLVNILDDNDM